MILTHRTTARTPRAALTLLVVWAGLGGLWVVVQASPVLLALGALLTLPAVWEFVTAKPSGLTLDHDSLHWFSGRHSGQVALHTVDHIRLDTRLDLSVTASAVLHSGRRVRLPQDALPPVDRLVSALEAAGIRTRRQHFSLLG